MDWEDYLQRSWGRVRFGRVHVHSESGRLFFEVHVDLAGLDPGAVRVELFAIDSTPITMASSGDGAYRAEIETSRSADDFTARVIPQHPNVSIPLELNQILWQK